jgi:hypothetical protein
VVVVVFIFFLFVPKLGCYNRRSNGALRRKVKPILLYKEHWIGLVDL